MRPFDYQRAEGMDHAGQLVAAENAQPIAGGTNLLDLMKLQVETPQALVDINRVGHAEIEDTDDGGLWIGTLATAATAHPRDHRRQPVPAYPLLLLH